MKKSNKKAETSNCCCKSKPCCVLVAIALVVLTAVCTFFVTKELTKPVNPEAILYQYVFKDDEFGDGTTTIYQNGLVSFESTSGMMPNVKYVADDDLLAALKSAIDEINSDETKKESASVNWRTANKAYSSRLNRWLIYNKYEDGQYYSPVNPDQWTKAGEYVQSILAEADVKLAP